MSHLYKPWTGNLKVFTKETSKSELYPLIRYRQRGGAGDSDLLVLVSYWIFTALIGSLTATIRATADAKLLAKTAFGSTRFAFTWHGEVIW